jgi:hypothetical protein
MKKILIISAIVIAGIAFSLVLMLNRGEDTDTPQDAVTFPTDVGDATGSTTAQQQGSFLDSPESHEDPNNPGIYFIGYQPNSEDASASPYLITFTKETGYFNVAITQEPIGETRRAAEKYLMAFLRLTQERMCSLNYTVYVANSVNTQYSGTNLGFSFCPGAVQLPQ